MTAAAPSQVRRNRAAVVVGSALVCIALVLAGCASEPPANLEPAEYRAELARICGASFAEQDSVPRPADSGGAADFAIAVSDILDREAERTRDVLAPDDLDDDHRAFVQNTQDQADAWRELALTDPADAGTYGSIGDTILALSLGRDDLATDMSLPECARNDE